MAAHDGVQVMLRKPPALASNPTATEIDYAPGVVAMIRDTAGPIRDMRADEVRDASEKLARMAAAAQDAAYGECTIVVVNR